MKKDFFGSSDPRVLIAYISVCILWGSTYLAIRVGVTNLPPALFAGIRFILAGLILFAYAKIKGFKMPESWGDVRVSAVVGLFLLCGGNGLVVWSEQWVASGLASLLIATVPLFVALLDSVVPGGKGIEKLGWIGLLVGFGGVALLMSPGLEMGGSHLTGLVGILGAAFLWATGTVYSSRKSVSGSIVFSIAIQALAGGIALTLIGLLAGEAKDFHPNPAGIVALVYLVLFGSLGGYSAYIFILKAMPPAKAATYAYVNPVVAVALGYLILDEPVTIRTFISAVIILGGVLLVQMSRTKIPTIDTEIKEKLQSQPAGRSTSR